MVPLVASLISLAFNVGGNWLLIYGNWGCPKMGIAGAAVATTASWGVRAVITSAYLFAPKIAETYGTRRSMAFCWKKFAGIWRIGGPTAVQWLVDIGAWVVFLAVIIPPYGEVAMAASNVAMQYMHLSFMPAIGIGMALCSQVGFAIGEKRPERAYRKARVAFQVCGFYMGAIGLLFLVGGGWIMRLFTDDPQVIAVGRVVLIWAAIFQVFDAMCISYMNALRGAGDTKWPAAMVAFCCWVVFIGGGVACAKLFPELGLSAPWMFCTLYVSILGVALWWRWKAGAWQKIELFGKPPGAVEERSWVQPLDELECGVPDPAAGAIDPAGSLRSPE
jgi:MATE family multidrug resistance protein